MALARAGADRQEMHETIRAHSMEAWSQLQTDGRNPLADLLAADPVVTRWLPAEEVRAVMARGADAGDAAERCRSLARRIRETVVASSMAQCGSARAQE